MSLRDVTPPWRRQAQRSAERDAEVSKRVENAQRTSDTAVEAIRNAYALADERLHREY